MHPGNHWGGSLEVSNGNADDDQDRQGMSEDWDRASLYHQQQQQQFNDINDPVHHHHHHNLNDTQKSCRKLLKWSVWTLVIAFMVIALPIILVNTLPKHKSRPPPPDNYTLALHKALLFFNAQKCLEDGNDTTLNKNGLVGGYYDAGDNAKFHFPMAYTMTMLSWSVIEYSHKYESIGEYKHVRELIKWGTDYLLLTFNSSSTKISQIYCQVGGGQNGSTTPDDHSCWQRPEDMDYERPTQTCVSGPDLAGEMAAALAAASIVFKDNAKYSKKLVQGAETLYSFARDSGKRRSYSRDNTFISPYYNSTGYYDEYMWGAACWNNKLPAAMLLLTRLRIFLNPGYPAEDMLRMYHNTTCLNMCSYLRGSSPSIGLEHLVPKQWNDLIKQRGVQPLQYAANSAFLANLFADYLTASGGLYTRQKPYENELRGGFWHQIPRHVHHRGASIPNNKKFYSCKDGWKWFHSSKPNPNNITGAMVGGPDRFDRFRDVRSSYNYTEPTLAGNAGLVAALVSLTTTAGDGIDKNTIFSEIPPPGPQNPPPPPPWKP
ncbi:hypothetical protein FNV43_RR05645 [Rhamnella rubrinervis]|uniref:Endoglucanase n=1 Tax=Rhamnella rubrinervis TaxID=2594499 RepID=A0A8K0MQV1_9ROSA|nr:hypothetical protein FNV43_RR05645 [Rhamnella rubrinervis]